MVSCGVVEGKLLLKMWIFVSVLNTDDLFVLNRCSFRRISTTKPIGICVAHIKERLVCLVWLKTKKELEKSYLVLQLKLFLI